MPPGDITMAGTIDTFCHHNFVEICPATIPLRRMSGSPPNSGHYHRGGYFRRAPQVAIRQASSVPTSARLFHQQPIRTSETVVASFNTIICQTPGSNGASRGQAITLYRAQFGSESISLFLAVSSFFQNGHARFQNRHELRRTPPR